MCLSLSMKELIYNSERYECKNKILYINIYNIIINIFVYKNDIY